jgi:hypothetical protein
MGKATNTGAGSKSAKDAGRKLGMAIGKSLKRGKKLASKVTGKDRSGEPSQESTGRVKDGSGKLSPKLADLETAIVTRPVKKPPKEANASSNPVQVGPNAPAHLTPRTTDSESDATQEGGE